MKFYITLLLSLICHLAGSAQVKILFDATKAEMAGSADWVIDADSHNIYFSSTTHLPYASSGTTGGSNPLRYPSPAQSGITTSTTEDFWQGALSYWAIDCAKQGYTVESLPFNAQITYGNTSNTQDLTHYNVFVVDEPNMLFSASERDAIVSFVQNGGGLMIIADHDVSDRNNDGYDSPMVWNDLFLNNSIQTDPFGIQFDAANISQTSTNIANLPSNPILHGIKGNVAKAQWSNGNTMTLNTTSNSSVRGLIYKTGSSNSGTTNVMVAQATYQSGKVVAIGDSSIPDDGSGDTGDTLYDGYIADANGNHQILLMNAIIWLTTPYLGINDFENTKATIIIAPNPVQNKQVKLFYHASNSEEAVFEIYDAQGRIVQKNAVINEIQTIDCNQLSAGLYYGKVTSSGTTNTVKFIIN
jgi:hypothetical protein